MKQTAGGTSVVVAASCGVAREARSVAAAGASPGAAELAAAAKGASAGSSDAAASATASEPVASPAAAALMASVPAPAAAGGPSSFSSASCRVPRTARRQTLRPSPSSLRTAPCGRLSPAASGTREFSASSSPRKPTSTSSRLWTPGMRAINVLACNQRNSHVEDAPTNHMEAWRDSVERQALPSTANCSMAHKTVRLKARPQSLPSHPQAPSSSKASGSTSPSSQLTAHLALACARAARAPSSRARSSCPSLEKSFLKFFFWSRHCLAHSRSTSCFIWRAAA
mmetsp:Transcript_108777/g.351174  ORF Transcript_108777/g.351174 Transcript_108777/m.351174 type:complete len:283 (-) Transcript_108777:571-1419(-)